MTGRISEIPMDRGAGLGKGERKTGEGLLYARSLYFCYFLALGAFFPFLNLYCERIGLSGLQIGLLASFPALMRPFAGPLWGGLADRFGVHRHLLTLALVGTLVTGFSYSLTSLFTLLFLLSLVYPFSGSSIAPLMDSAALEVASSHARSYGQLRVWGTLGWIVPTWAVGWWLIQDELGRFYYAFAAFMAVAVLVSLFQPPRRHLCRCNGAEERAEAVYDLASRTILYGPETRFADFLHEARRSLQHRLAGFPAAIDRITHILWEFDAYGWELRNLEWLGYTQEEIDWILKQISNLIGDLSKIE